MYKLTDTTSIIRLADGAQIPNDPANSDYAQYLIWAEDNTAEAPDVITVKEATADEQIKTLEAGQARAIREAVLTGDTSRLKTIDDKIAALRQARVK